MGELAGAMPISRPAVSRHLRLPHGARRIYRLHDEGVAAVEAFVCQMWGDATARFRLTAENTRRHATVCPSISEETTS